MNHARHIADGQACLLPLSSQHTRAALQLGAYIKLRRGAAQVRATRLPRLTAQDALQLLRLHRLPR